MAFPRAIRLYNTSVFTPRRIVVACFLLTSFVLSRTLFLTRLPIFTDEAIYIRWGQIALGDPVHRFISLEDGKQPMFIWLMLPLLKTINDPLLAGRLISVASGFVSLVGLIVLGWSFFGETIGWFTGLLYFAIPFFVLYDRLALYDSLTTAIMIWSYLLLFYTTKKLRLDTALLAGMTIGAGLLTKSSAQFALVLIPSYLLVFEWKKKNVWARLFKWVGLMAIVIVLSMGFGQLLRLAPLFHMVRLKNLEFIVSFDEFIAHPLARFNGNLRGLSEWLILYLTIPVSLTALCGTLVGLKKEWRKSVLLSLWFAVPFLALAAFAKILYPRFILFMATPLLLLVALGFLTLWKLLRRSPFLLLTLPFFIFGYPMYASSQVIWNPVNMPIPKVDRFQLVDDWPAGYGVTEIATFFREEARSGPIVVGTEGTFGLTPAAFEIYLKDEKNIRIKGYWPISSGIDELHEIARSGTPTYLVLKDTQAPEPLWPVELIARYQKGKGNVYMGLYKFLSDR